MNGFKCSIEKPKGRPYWRLRYRLPGSRKDTVESLGVRNKDVAERKRLIFIEEYEKEQVGLIPEKSVRLAASMNLDSLVDEYIEDLRSQNRSEKYCENTRRQLRKVAGDCGWKTLSEVSHRKFLKWRTKNGNKGPKTLNNHLGSWISFFGWLVKTEQAERNPFDHVSKVDESKDVRRKRSAALQMESNKRDLVLSEFRTT